MEKNSTVLFFKISNVINVCVNNESRSLFLWKCYRLSEFTHISFKASHATITTDRCLNNYNIVVYLVIYFTLYRFGFVRNKQIIQDFGVWHLQLIYKYWFDKRKKLIRTIVEHVAYKFLSCHIISTDIKQFGTSNLLNENKT